MAATHTAQWSSRFAFIMAAVGSSVGLGNLWRFSAELGTNGGAAFLIIYAACIILVGIPVLMSEYIIGRAGNAPSAVGSNLDLAQRSGVSKGWSLGAWLGMLASFLIVSFYCVVAAWVLAYIQYCVNYPPSGKFYSSPAIIYKLKLRMIHMYIYYDTKRVQSGIELISES